MEILVSAFYGIDCDFFQPEGAQGVSCAVEDSLALALLLKHYSASETENETIIAKTAMSYEDIRLPRVSKILLEAKTRADQRRQITWTKSKMREIVLGVLCMCSPLKEVCCSDDRSA